MTRLVSLKLQDSRFIVYNTGAQITILRGNASSSPIHCCDVTKPPYLISGELCSSPLLCLRTPCDVGAPSSASLCSEHINQTQWTAVVGDVTSPTNDTMCHYCAPVVYNDKTVRAPAMTRVPLPKCVLISLSTYCIQDLRNISVIIVTNG